MLLRPEPYCSYHHQQPGDEGVPERKKQQRIPADARVGGWDRVGEPDTLDVILIGAQIVAHQPFIQFRERRWRACRRSVRIEELDPPAASRSDGNFSIQRHTDRD
jgi:hypothetical protein